MRIPHIYLLPDYVYISEQQDLLKEFHSFLFESELEGWWREPSDWPAIQDFKTFNKWFDVDFHSCISDFGDSPLIDDEAQSEITRSSVFQQIKGWFRQ